MAYASASQGGYGGGPTVIHTDASHADVVSISDAELLFTGHLERKGPDLILTGHDGQRHIVPDYFSVEHPAALVAPNGAQIAGDLVELLAGSQAPGQYAQDAQPQASAPTNAIGRIEKVIGAATVVRNGIAVALHVGDAVYKNDVVQTGEASSVGISFPDGTALNLVASTRMALNDYAYDPNGSSNSALFSLVQGTFAFVAGRVAHTGDMKIGTPVATMGIRGTAGWAGNHISLISATSGDVFAFALAHDPGVDTHGRYTLYAVDLNGNVLLDQNGNPIIHDTVGDVDALALCSIDRCIDQPITSALSDFGLGIMQGAYDSSHFNANPNSNPSGHGSGDPPFLLLEVFPQNGGGNLLAFNSFDFTLNHGTNNTGLSFNLNNAPQPVPASNATMPTVTIGVENSSTFIETNAVISKADAAAGIIIDGAVFGTDVNRQTVTVDLVNAGNVVVDSFTTTVSNHAWSVDLTKAEAQALHDGLYTVTATVSDVAGSSGTASLTVIVDETAPTITINQIDANDIINASEAGQTGGVVVSGKALDSGTGVDGQPITVDIVNAANVVVDSFTTTESGGNWSVDLTKAEAKALNDGSYTVTASVSDVAGNSSMANQPLTVDETTPTVGVAVASSDVNLAANTALVTFSFSEATSDFKLADTTAVGGTLGPLTTTDGGLTYTATFTANPNTDISNGSVSVTAGSWHDATGNNPGTGATSTAFVVDTVTPTVGVAVASSDVNLAANTALVTFSFSEATSDFKLADTTAVGGTLGPLTTTDGGLTYTATFTANPNTDISNGSVSVTAGSWHDATGNNPGTGATSTAFVVDTVTPTVGVAVASSDVNLAANTALVTFSFSEATSDFKLADTTAVGGTLGPLTTTDGGLTYTATFTANPNTDISNGSVSVTAGSWHDATGNNPGTGATSTAFVVDTVTPTVGVAVASSDVNLAANTALVTFSFSEATSDFKLADTTAVGGTLGPLTTTDGGLTYTATFTANPNTDISNGSVSVTAGSWHDATGNNPGTGATSTAFVVDTVTPTVGVAVASSDVNLAANTALVTFSFSEATSDFKLADTTAVGGTLGPLTTTDGGLTYTATFTANPNTDISNGSVSVTAGSWHDATGNNPGTGATSTAFVVDTVTPTVGVAVASSDVNLAANTALVTFSFSEATSDFKLADTTAVGGTLGPLTTTDGGLTYTATFTANPNTDISNGSVSVTAGSWHDATGNNPGTGATSTAFVVDTVTPTVGVAVASSDVNLAANTALVTFSFSEATSDFKLADTTAVGGTLGPLTTTDGGLTYTATFTANPNTDISNGSVSVTAGSWHDATGNNPGTGATSTAFVVDTVTPTVGVAVASSDVNLAANTALVTFSFSEATSDFKLADTTAVGGTLGPLTTTDGGLTYTATFTANPNTDISNGSVSVTAGSWHDATGNNPGTGATSTAFVVDTVTPTVGVAVASSDVNLAANTALVTFSFSEATSDFKLADTTAVGGTLGPLTTTDGGLTYTATFTANPNTDISNGSVSVTAGSWHDATGNNPGTGATSTAFVVDTVTPTVGVAVASSDVNLAANTALVTFSFSEATSDFKLADTTAVGGTLGPLTTTDGGLTYTATFTANPNTDISNGSVSVTAGSWHDATGNNPGTGATSTAFVVDTVTPTVGVAVASSDVNLAANTALVTFSFSEATSDFKLADTTAVGGTLGPLTTTDGGLTYTATFTANPNTDISNGSVSVTAGSWHDATGNNPGTGATSTAFVVDTVTPTVGVAVASSDVNLAANTALVTFSFSEATSDFKLADTTAVGGTLGPLTTTDGGLTYTATFTANPNTDISNGSVSVTAGSWHDATGNNPGTGATSTAFVVDTVTPTVGVAVASSDVNLAANTALVTFSFSEATSDFKLADTTAVGGTLGPLTTTDGGLTYTATFTANPNTDISNGSVSVTAGSWHDATGNNPGTGATSTAFVVDTVTPTVGVAVASSDVNLAANTALVTFSFSEATSDFKLADTTAVGGTLGPLTTTDGGLTYTATFTANPNTDISNGSVSVTAGSWHDATGNNPGTGATSTAFVVDTVTPTVGVAVASSDVNLAANTALVTFSFSEATSDFKLADTTAVGGTLGPLTTTDGGLTYTATFTANPNTDISNGSVSVTAGSWHDATGNNPGTGATSTAFVVDTVTPTVGVAVASSDVNLAANTALVTFSFSEATSDFKLADTTAVGGTLGPLTTTDGGLTYTATFTANPNTDISNGSVSVTAGSWHDATGNNPGTGATSTAFVVDTVTPTVGVAVASSDVNLAANTALVTFSFSEATSDFKLADTTAVGGTLGPLTTTDGGLTYTATFTANPNTDISNGSVSVTAGSWHDATGNNPGTGATSTAFVVDTVTPTVGVAVASSDVNLAANTALVTFSFSEATSDFKLADTTAVGGTLGPLTTTDGGLTYTATFTANPNTDISNGSVSVTAGSWHDATGNNPGTGATSTAFVVDTVTPTVGVAVASSDVNLAANTALVTFSFSEATSDFKLADTTAVGGTLGPLTTTDGGLTYTATFTANPNTDISNGSVSVTAGSWHDATGNNPGTGATSTAFVVDTVTPTVGVAVASSDVNLAANTALVTFSFSEATSDFKLADTTAVGGTLGPLTTTDGGLTYTATFTANPNTDISNGSVSVTAGSWHDATGNNPGTGATSTAFVVDTVTPTVGVATSNTDVTVAHNTATITFSFSEAPTSFTLADTTAVGGTLGPLTEVNATTYTATFTGAANTDINSASVGVIAGSWQENNGNPGAAGSTGSFTVDTVAPVITVPGAQTFDVNEATAITGVGVSESGNTSGETFTVTLTDTHGDLSANTSLAGGGGTITGSGTTSLTLIGTLSQVYSDLGTLSDTDGTTGSDTIKVNATDGFGNAATQHTIAVTVDQQREFPSEPPTLSLGGTAKIVSEESTVILPSITVTPVDSDDILTVTIAGLPMGATVTDSTDGKVFSGSSFTLTEAEAESTLTLNDGTNAGNFTLQVTANNTTTGESASSASQSIAVTVTNGPTASTITTSGTGITSGSGDLDAGHVVTLAVNMSENVTVTGTPELILNDGGIASYTGGTGTSTLTFSYTVASGQNTADLEVDSFSLNGGTIKDPASNPATLTNGANTIVVGGSTWNSGTPYHPVGTLLIDTTPPIVTSFSDSSNHISGNYNLTLKATDNLSGVVSVTIYDTTKSIQLAAATLTSGTSTNGTWTVNEKGTGIATGDQLTATVTDAAGNTTASTTTAPAGIAGSSINLALEDSSGVGALTTVTISGMPANWSLNQGTNNGNGTWTVETNDLSALTVLTAATYSGAMVLGVTGTWANANGSTGTAFVADNVEAYAPGLPIFAWSGNDTLTGAGGNDLFVFAQPIGNDTIYNFNVATDKIDLTGFAGIAGFGNLAGHIAGDGHGDAVITLGASETITLHGVDAASLTGGDFVFNQTPVVDNAGTMAVSDGAMLPLSGTIDNSGTVALNSGGDETNLEIVGGGLTLQGGGQIVLSDSHENVIFAAAAGTTLTNVDNAISGAGQIGTGDGNLTLVNKTAGTIDANYSDGTLTLDTGNTVVNSGLMEATNGGTLQITDNVSNSGTLAAEGGTLMAAGNVSGSGDVIIGGRGHADFAGAVDQNVAFTGPGTLELDHSQSFSGTVSGFGAGDAIDLNDLAYSANETVTWTQGGGSGTLTVNDNGTTETITLNGNYTQGEFALTNDGTAAGGTEVISVPVVDATAVPSTSGVAGDISFADANASDTFSASITPDGAGYVGAFSLDPVTESNGSESVRFEFSLGGDQINLAPGQTLTQSYGVTVADAQGTAVNQTISVSIGGPGNDNFAFAPGVGADTIANFNAKADTIELDHFANIQNMQQLAALITTDAHGDAVIELGHQDSITLPGVSTNYLQAHLHSLVHLS